MFQLIGIEDSAPNGCDVGGFIGEEFFELLLSLLFEGLAFLKLGLWRGFFVLSVGGIGFGLFFLYFFYFDLNIPEVVDLRAPSLDLTEKLVGNLQRGDRLRLDSAQSN